MGTGLVRESFIQEQMIYWVLDEFNRRRQAVLGKKSEQCTKQDVSKQPVGLLSRPEGKVHA